MHLDATSPSATPDRRANLALAAAVAAAVAWIVAGIVSDALYWLLPVFGTAAIVIGRGARQHGALPARARWGMLLGAFFTLLFVAFVVVAIVNGDV